MTANQFRATLARLGLPQRGASRLFNVNERTVRRWALGEGSIPENIIENLQRLVADQQKPKRAAS